MTNKIVEEINEYLSNGGFFNPELMDHQKVSDLLLRCRNEMNTLQEAVDRLAVTVRRIYAEKLPDTWFVCGEMGPKDANGLPDRIEVCPAYGCDWSQIYQKTEHTIGGMGS